jgi:uncharacterized phage protein gp47/JayE
MAQFEDQTFDAIIERLLSRIPDDIDKRQGSVVRDLLSPIAAELSQAYIEMDNVLNLGFADTTYGEFLDLRVSEQGLTRKPAVPAEGVLTFTGPDGQVIPKDTRVSTDNEIYFVTKADATIVEGAATVQAIAEVGGTAGNVAYVTIKNVIGDLAGVVTVTNLQPFNGGLDEETDDELLDRYKEKVSKPATSGNKFDYEKWAKEIIGVSDAKVYPLWNGPGTVRVVLVNSEKRTPSQTVIDDARDYIEEQRPVGATVTVEGVQEIPVDVSATLTLTSGTDINVVKTEITDNITDYFKNIGFTETIVRYTQIANALLDADGVVDYADLRVNGGTANVLLNDDEVPVIGVITLT